MKSDAECRAASIVLIVRMGDDMDCSMMRESGVFSADHSMFSVQDVDRNRCVEMIAEITWAETCNQDFVIYGAGHSDAALWNGASCVGPLKAAAVERPLSGAVPVEYGIGMLGVEGFICQRLLLCAMKVKKGRK